MANIKHSEESAQGFAESWDAEVRELWPKSYPESLSNELQKLGVKSILDCAGGTGYPSLELKRMGWDITYSDGWDTMLRFFKQRLEETQLEIPAYHSRWENLSEIVPNTCDALLCAGNSFVGINSYSPDLSIAGSDTKPRMQLALRQFYKILNTGGVLYIDLSKKSFSAPKEPYSQAKNSSTHRIFSTISYDSVRNIRTKLTTRSSLLDGTEQDIITKVTPIFAEELITLLHKAGFARIEHSTVNAAAHVDSFFAFKD